MAIPIYTVLPYCVIYVTGTVHTVMLFLSSNFACARIYTCANPDHSLVMDADVSAPRLTNRERARNRRAAESEEAREQQIARDRACRRQPKYERPAFSRRRAQDRAWHAARTSQAGEARLQQQRTTMRQARATETPKVREARLHQLRVTQQQQLAAETPEEGEACLLQLRVNQQQQLAAETPEEGEARLLQLRVNQQQRLAAETPEEGEARLLQLRINQQQRLATETPEERGARLLRLRVRQQERLTAETPEETEARRQRDREIHMKLSCSLSHEQPLFNQPAVRSKMSRFHSGMAALQLSTCITCMEKFPGMTVRITSAGTECVRCNRDMHTPEAYSLDNNMHPGPVPRELLVRFIYHRILPPVICYLIVCRG